MLQYMLTKTGLLTSTVVESGGFVDTAGTGEPDVQFHVLPTFVGFADRPPDPGHGISIGRASCVRSRVDRFACAHPTRPIVRFSSPMRSPRARM